MSNPIDEYFEKGLEDLEVKPRADLWKEKIAPQMQHEKKKVVIWYRAAAVLIILLSGWFAVKYFGASQEQPTLILDEKAVVEQPTLLPEVNVNAVETNGDDEGLKEQLELNRTTPRIANKQVEEDVKRDQPVVLAQAETEELEPAGGEELTAEKPTYKVKLSLNSMKYTAAEVVDAEPETVTDYAKDQWENIKSGEKLDAPPKDWFSLPKVKLEGNPLKRVLASRDE